MTYSLVFPFANAAAALFSILASRFSDPEHAADDRTLGRCMLVATCCQLSRRYCCMIYDVVQGGPIVLYLEMQLIYP